MPELPEVETIRRGLRPRVVGRTICEVCVGQRRILRVPARRLAQIICGQKIQALDRRGKFLVFELDDHCLILHLGMTGQLTLRDPARTDRVRFIRHPVTGLQRIVQHAPDRHTHLQILFENGTALLFRDIRQFGRVSLIKRKAGALADFFAGLGLEPFTPSYTLEAFLEKFRHRKLKIKSLLLDQSFVAGVGNIYADEALFEAGIHPARSVRSLRRWEKERLFEAIGKVLLRGISFGGTSLRDYVNSEGEQGSHQEELRVYGRRGQYCLCCASEISRTVINQRGTHFCPRCQPRRPCSARAV